MRNQLTITILIIFGHGFVDSSLFLNKSGGHVPRDRPEALPHSVEEIYFFPSNACSSSALI